MLHKQKRNVSRSQILPIELARENLRCIEHAVMDNLNEEAFN